MKRVQAEGSAMDEDRQQNLAASDPAAIDVAQVEDEVRARAENILAARRRRELLASGAELIATDASAVASVANITPEIITAELAPPPLSPWRFGLRALLTFMGIASLQCALMSYVGILAGILVGIAGCMVLFAWLLCVAILLPRSKRAWLESLDVIGLRIIALMTMLVLGSIFAGGGMLVFQLVGERQRIELCYDKVGFRGDVITVSDRDSITQVLVVRKVKPASPALESGLRENEMIVLQEPVDKFYERMSQSPGQAFDLDVATGSSSVALETIPHRTITIEVPGE